LGIIQTALEKAKSSRRFLMRAKNIFPIILIIVLVVPVGSQTDIQLLDQKVVKEILNEISGIRAKEYVTGISQFNRTDGAYENTGYEKAVDYVMSHLNKAGLQDVELLLYPSDGAVSHGTWLSHPGFKVKSAQLSVIRPVKEKWCDFSVTAVSLMPYSNGNGVYEGEVIYVGKGTSEKDYEGKDVEGKIVFADRADVGQTMREAVIKRGALGIIAAFSGNKRLAEYPSAAEVNRIYLKAEERKKASWGFSLSRVQTEKLRQLLKRKTKVVMRAEIYAETFSGNMAIISTAIKGSTYPDQEIVFMAHLDHYKPGACDNASGCAGLIETAATLTKLIDNGKLPQPLRTIRFLWVPELEGMAAYIENNKETAKKGIIGINFDMIGEDTRICQTVMQITRAPLSRPSFLDGLIEHYASFVDRLGILTRVGPNNMFSYRIVDYMGGSDHLLFNDSQIGVPSTMFVHLNNRFWHTSLDTPDKIDPAEMKRSIMLGLCMGWTAANYSDDQVYDLLELTYRSAERRMERYALKYIGRLKKSSSRNIHTTHRNIQKYLEILLDNGIQSLSSVLVNLPNRKENSETIEKYRVLLQKYAEIQKLRITNYYINLCLKKGIETQDVAFSELEKECSAIIPLRLIGQSLGTKAAFEMFSAQNLGSISGYDMLSEMLNFSDGKNSLLKIRDAVSAQYREISLKWIKSLFEILKENGIVRY
jgi:hypothetical protein